MGVVACGAVHLVWPVRPTANGQPKNSAAYTNGKMQELGADIDDLWNIARSDQVQSPDGTKTLVAYTTNGPVELSIKFDKGDSGPIDKLGVKTKDGMLEFTKTQKGWNSSDEF